MNLQAAMATAVKSLADPLAAPKIRCPHCGVCWDSKVTDTRGGTTRVWRRRECKGCGKRFTTHEMIVTHD